MKSGKWIRTLLLIVFILLCIVIPVCAAENVKGDDRERETENQGGISLFSIPIEDQVIDDGQVNDTVFWEIREDEEGVRKLHIFGTGPMTDYKDKAEQPWRSYASSIKQVIISDGVTRIGNHSLSHMSFSDISFAETVESIGVYSFAYGSNLTSITIPGHIKTVEQQAFVFHYALADVVLEEGVEVIGNDAFGSNKSASIEVHIPASLRQTGENMFWNVARYTISEENPYYCVIDDAIYSKDKSILVDYPKKKIADSFVIPDHVTEIGASAVSRVKGTKRLYIPSSVQKTQQNYVASHSDWEEVYIEDGAQVSTSGTFYGNSKLKVLRLPENTVIKEISQTVGYGCTSLEELKLPDGVLKISYLGNPLSALKRIYYDAKNAAINDKALIDPSITYEVLIGSHVDQLPKAFRWLLNQAEAVVFETGNQIMIEEGAFSTAEGNLAGLFGTVYVDGQGIIYVYDAEKGTAQIVHFQGDSKKVVIPASIHPEEGISCQVVSIKAKAFSGKTMLEEVQFEDVSLLATVGDYAFSDCSALCSVNRLTTVEEAEGIFSMAESVGYYIYYNTGLFGASASFASTSWSSACWNTRCGLPPASGRNLC